MQLNSSNREKSWKKKHKIIYHFLISVVSLVLHGCSFGSSRLRWVAKDFKKIASNWLIHTAREIPPIFNYFAKNGKISASIMFSCKLFWIKPAHFTFCTHIKFIFYLQRPHLPTRIGAFHRELFCRAEKTFHQFWYNQWAIDHVIFDVCNVF